MQFSVYHTEINFNPVSLELSNIKFILHLFGPLLSLAGCMDFHWKHLASWRFLWVETICHHRGLWARMWEIWVALGLEEKQDLSICIAQSSSNDLYKDDRVFWIPMVPCLYMLSLGLEALAWKGEKQTVCKLQNNRANHVIEGLPICRYWYFKTKHSFASTTLQVPKMLQWLFWEILAFCCFSHWSTKLFFFRGLEKNIPPSLHTFKQTINSEI